MINLTKNQYYHDRKIPMVVPSHPLQSLPPLSEHLLDPIPHIGEQVEKLLNCQEMQKNLSLELANANKIIHALEEEIQLLLDKNSEFQKELNEVESEKSRLIEKVQKLGKKIDSMGLNFKKKDYEWAKKYENQRNYLSNLLTQQQEKIKYLDQILGKNQHKYKQELSKFQSIIEQTHIDYNNKIIVLEKDYDERLKNLSQKLNQSIDKNTSLKKKFFQIEECNQKEFQAKDRRISQQDQMIKSLKTDYEHTVFQLKQRISSLQRTLDDMQNQNKHREQQYKRSEAQQKAERDRLHEQLRVNEEIQNCRYETIMKEKEKFRISLSEKNKEIVEKELFISQLKSDVKRYQNSVQDLEDQWDRKTREHRRQMQDLKFYYDQKEEQWMNSLKNRLEESNQKCRRELISIHQIESKKDKDHIKAIEDKNIQLQRKVVERQSETGKIIFQFNRLQQKYQQKENQIKNLHQNMERTIKKEIQEQKCINEKENKIITVNYEKKINDLKESYENENKEIYAKMLQKMEDYEQRLHQNKLLLWENQSLQKIKQQLTKALQEKDQEISELTQTSKKYEKKIEEKQFEERNFARNFETQQSQKQQIILQNEYLNKQLNSLKQKYATSQTQMKEMKEKMNQQSLEMEQMTGRMKQQLLYAHTQKEQMSLKVKILEQSMNEKTHEIQILQKENENIEKIMREKNLSFEEYRRNLQNHFNEKLSEIKGEYMKKANQIKQSFEEKNEKYQILKKDYSELQVVYNSKIHEFETSKEEFKRMSQEYQSLIFDQQDQNKKIMNEITQQREMNEKLQNDLTEYQKIRKQYIIKIEKLEEEIQIFSEEKKNMEYYRQDLEQNTERYKKMVELEKRRNDEIELSHQKVIEQKNELLRKMRNQLRNNLQKSEIQIKENEKRNIQKHSQMQNLLMEMEKQALALKNENICHKRKIEELERSLQSIYHQNRSLTQRKSQLEQKEQQFEFKFKKLQEKIVSQNGEFMKVQSLLQQNKRSIRLMEKERNELFEKLTISEQEKVRFEKKCVQISEIMEKEKEKFDKQFETMINQYEQKITEAIEETDRRNKWEMEHKIKQFSSMQQEFNKMSEYSDYLKEIIEQRSQKFRIQKDRLMQENKRLQKEKNILKLRYEQLENDYKEIKSKYTFLTDKFNIVYEQMSGCRTQLSPTPTQSRKRISTSPKRETKIYERTSNIRQTQTNTWHKNENISSGDVDYYSRFSSVNKKKNPITTLIGDDESLLKSEVNNEYQQTNSDKMRNQ